MSAAETYYPRWTLGLDIGSASIGWALVDRSGGRVGAAGVRIFPAGVDEREFERGQPGSSHNTERRRYRLQRRQIRRRARRQRSLFLLLQRHGLLPGAADAATSPDQAASPERRNRILTALDQELLARWSKDEQFCNLAAPAQVLPYFLRARALDVRLEPEEVGRIIYHLGQRRGFKSNRREAKSEKQTKKQSEKDDQSTVKASIRSLREKMAGTGARSLGEYFSRLDPAVEAIRGPGAWTHRDMHREEFSAIWGAQAPHHPTLTPALRAQIWPLLYGQRPVRGGKVGRCELERGQARAPMASLAAQRFRLLQKVNDLRLVDPDLQEYAIDPGERETLLAALEREGSLTFAEIKKRKLVRVPMGYHLNLEHGGEKTLPGNKTAAAMRRVFGDRWDSLGASEREAAVNTWLRDIDDDGFSAIGRTRFGLSGEALEAWSGLQLADGYAKLSAVALEKLLPRMERGESFKAAETVEYGDRFSGGAAHDRLRPVVKALASVPNPAVMRALSELRQLVNGIAREYGKPWEIRIELARDLKRNAKQRQMMSEQMRERQTRRKKIETRILQEAGIPKPSGADIEKGLLYEQSAGQCPYCGGQMSFADAFNGEVAEVDHILPRNRFPDDSFGNKVLAHTRCNRDKTGQTPFEAFSGDEQLWDQILTRVKGWGDEGKLRAFQITSQEDLDSSRENSFAARRLNDTRYTSKLAARYLGELYGGRDVATPDGAHRQAIFATTGMATAALRRGWGLEAILGRHNEKGKSRLDHRHHAVDALVIALTSAKEIQQLSLAAAADAFGGRRASSKTLVAPWPEFVDSVRPIIEAIQVSHRPSRRLRGALHADTVYGRGNARAKYTHVRRKVQALTDVEAITDPAVRSAVRDRLAALGTDDVKKLENNWPLLGGQRPIRFVRTVDRALAGLATVGRGPSGRLVSESGNHHIAIFAGRNPRGRDRWLCQIVSVLEATRRRTRKLPLVERAWGEGDENSFLFSLMKNDLVALQDERTGAEALFVLRKFSAVGEAGADLSFVPHSRAGLDAELRADGWIERITSLDKLRQRGCRKVTIDVLGRIQEAHD